MYLLLFIVVSLLAFMSTEAWPMSTEAWPISSKAWPMSTEAWPIESDSVQIVFVARCVVKGSFHVSFCFVIL